ncbi:HNH endonuclease signature motif containing protein [Corynebacterium pelargi]|uniref:Uncharacterized protein n=1 Tax=Corynebacterium pelargi TaxID=1471400 RepID=A0A410W640_9CORY|nr:HNH endonuclease signature motif containing protein [Corynebacterium pelargi]QAU51422.1 hypothetical protein CPELA_00590 [Corynebacterium pelargi]GGG81066.1 hypothetical protein GCM10007338_19610 [Corynebacterium pelargi]
MDISQAFSVFGSQGVAVASWVYEQVEELVAQRGRRLAAEWLSEQLCVPMARARALLALSFDLFGRRCEEPEVRRAAVEAAREAGLGLELLLAVNSAVRALRNRQACSVDKLRLEVYQLAAGLSVAEAKDAARARVRGLNAQLDQEPTQQALRVSATPDALGLRHLHAAYPDADAASIEHALRQAANKLFDDPACTLSHTQAMAEALKRAVLAPTGWNTNNNEHPPATTEHILRHPMVIIPAIGMRNLGDGMLATTDGATIHYTELCGGIAEQYGYLMIYAESAEGHPEPVGGALIKQNPRFASPAQRLMIAADQLLCADPNCHRRAANCHMHHIQAWANGGETTLNNLIACCATHNRQNDDNPKRPKNGRYIRHPHTGQAAHQAPNTPPNQATTNRRDLAQRSGRALMNQHFTRATQTTPGH